MLGQGRPGFAAHDPRPVLEHSQGHVSGGCADELDVDEFVRTDLGDQIGVLGGGGQRLGQAQGLGIGVDPQSTADRHEILDGQQS